MSREETTQIPPSQAPYPPPYGYFPPQEDEINLGDLARSVWKTRGIWVITMIIVSVLFWGWWAAKHLNSPAPRSYSSPVIFTFPGIEKGTYPNGTPFQRSDLIAPSVLKDVFERNKLEQYGFSLNGFSPLVRITPYALDLTLIQEKYSLQLEEMKKPSPQEIDELRQRQKEEVDQTSLRGARLIFNPEDSDIPDNIIANILADIPEVWAMKAIEERGVLSLDMDIINESIFHEDILDGLDYLISFDYLSEKIGMIEKNINALKGQPNGLTARDLESGMALPDLLRRLEDVKSYQLRLLIDPTRELGLSKNRSVTLHHYQNKLIQLQQKQQELRDKAKLTRRTYQNYVGKQNKASGSEVPQQMMVPTLPNSITPQLGDNFLDRIMGLSDKVSDLDFRQNLARQQHEYEEQAIEISTEINEIARNINALEHDIQDQDQDQDIRRYFYAEIKQGIPVLMKQLRTITQISNRLQQQIGAQNRGNTSHLYLPASEKVAISGGHLSLAKREKLTFVLMLVLTTFIVIPVVMIRNSMRNKKEEATD